MANDMLKLECPNCQTAYTAARCGISLMPEQNAAVTVQCMVCAKQFEVRIEPNSVTDELGWFAKYILRRKPSQSLRGHAITDCWLR